MMKKGYYKLMKDMDIRDFHFKAGEIKSFDEWYAIFGTWFTFYRAPGFEIVDAPTDIHKNNK